MVKDGADTDGAGETRAALSLCPLCGQKVSVKRLTQHMDYRCPKRTSNGPKMLKQRTTADMPGWWHGGE